MSDNQTKNSDIGIIKWSNSTLLNETHKEEIYVLPVLDVSKIESVEDCAKILKFLSDRILEPLPQGISYSGFSEVAKYYTGEDLQ